MPFIIDNNVVQRILCDKSDPKFCKLSRCLFEGKPFGVVFFYGGKLAEEYCRNKTVLRLLVQLDRAGRARRIDSSLIEYELKGIAQQKIKSDDEHVLALARASGARVLCSEDGDLISDFKNLSIIPRPKGKVYSESNKKMLFYCK